MFNLGLLIGLVLVLTVAINFLRTGRMIREMLAYSTSLPIETSTMPPVGIIKPVYGADAYTRTISVLGRRKITMVR